MLFEMMCQSKSRHYKADLAKALKDVKAPGDADTEDAAADGKGKRKNKSKGGGGSSNKKPRRSRGSGRGKGTLEPPGTYVVVI